MRMKVGGARPADDIEVTRKGHGQTWMGIRGTGAFPAQLLVMSVFLVSELWDCLKRL